MIAIVDYGMANLRSVEKALLRVGGHPIITSDPHVVARADQIVLPGVGAFCAAMANLEQSGLRDAVLQAIAAGKPFLGICLGLQLLFESSTEMGGARGLGLIPGHVVRFFENAPPPTLPDGMPLKVPHIGWNALHLPRSSRLFRDIEEGARVYFVHSYYPEPSDASVVAATTDYGVDFCCAIEIDHIAATQFHPEKSGTVGLQILRNFVRWN
ncbi:MAG: imidazole glycerol phosphate synthase subunit HisH [Chloroherpetonaceae bacterium]|nr:imidazole glycerol phosphate synthase subunit HisH [Chthonomonadaceae bacterium]MDW8208718.1 imidazole glycerol phosphate synthase subunit HisH [Chloroherpetonaceae bacterium]